MQAKCEAVLCDTILELERAQAALERVTADRDRLELEYSHLKYTTIESVWRYFPTYCEEFRYLPKIDVQLRESYETAGGYSLGYVIGEGQFSTVRKCKKIGSRDDMEFAVKIIKKENILSIDGVLKMERELRALHLLGAVSQHPNVVRFVECIHGRKAVYIITEEMPLDLVSRGIPAFVHVVVTVFFIPLM